jgi:hypothetical protein
MINWKDVEGSVRGILSGTIPAFACRDRGKPSNPRHDSRSPGRVSNTGHPEYEAEVLTTRPRRSVRPISRNYMVLTAGTGKTTTQFHSE